MNAETLHVDNLDRVLLFKTSSGTLNYMNHTRCFHMNFFKDNIKFNLNVYRSRMARGSTHKFYELEMMHGAFALRYCWKP